jgi:hypothetical protein
MNHYLIYIVTIIALISRLNNYGGITIRSSPVWLTCCYFTRGSSSHIDWCRPKLIHKEESNTSWMTNPVKVTTRLLVLTSWLRFMVSIIDWSDPEKKKSTLTDQHFYQLKSKPYSVEPMKLRQQHPRPSRSMWILLWCTLSSQAQRLKVQRWKR